MISFEGSKNTNHKIMITKDDTQQLRELLQAKKGGLFETDYSHRTTSPKP